MSRFLPQAAERSTESTIDQLIATGAAGTYGYDPIDGDSGYQRAGSSARELPYWTLERSRAYSIAGYRANPMARAIIDTYIAFCVGDSGLSLQASNPDVRKVAEEFWTDHRNSLHGRQEAMLRDHLLMGESLYEMLVGETTGVTRFSVIDPNRIADVDLLAGNPLWPSAVHIRMQMGDDTTKSVAAIDDLTKLRSGDVLFWASFKALLTDRRGVPFLSPILDWLDSYDTVLSNLVDRTALARYLVWDVTVDGGQEQIDQFIKDRKGTHVPKSGSVEVHNKGVTWDLKNAQTGSLEDTNTTKAVLTNVAGGAGLAKTWLADPEDANRATALTMAEPVRRRVRGVQKLWLDYVTDMVRFAVDQAVAAHRLPPLVDVENATGTAQDITQKQAAETITVTGPQVAAADAQVMAQVLMQLAQGLDGMVQAGVLTTDAAQIAAKKAWEDYVGMPYQPELGRPDADPNDVATAVDDAQKGGTTLQLAKQMNAMSSMASSLQGTGRNQP